MNKTTATTAAPVKGTTVCEIELSRSMYRKLRINARRAGIEWQEYLEAIILKEWGRKMKNDPAFRDRFRAGLAADARGGVA